MLNDECKMWEMIKHGSVFTILIKLALISSNRLIDLPLHFHFTTIFVTSFGHVIVALLYFMLVFCQLLIRIATRHWCTCIRTSDSDLLPKTFFCNMAILGGEINQLINY